MSDTIYALSSGGLPCGIAIIRVSGPQARIAIETMCTKNDFGKGQFLSAICHPRTGEVLDQGLVLTFIAPASFTGEDVVEFHLHGGRAVVSGVLDALASLEGCRPSEPGEFTYRAFENGKLDLTQALAVGDLIASESDKQRQMALGNVAGAARRKIETWAKQLLKMRALIEAEIDFVEEEDIPGSVSDKVWIDVEALCLQIGEHLVSLHKGEIIRNGFRVAILGNPNAGKSTLLNALAKRDAAIVSKTPGTTRDVIEVKLSLGGHVVVVSDTAGLRKTNDEIETEGIKRSITTAKQAHLKLWLQATDDDSTQMFLGVDPELMIETKCDLIDNSARGDSNFDLSISAIDHMGTEELVKRIIAAADNAVDSGTEILFNQKRQQEYLAGGLIALKEALENTDEPLEIRAEDMRRCAISLGHIIGMPDNEDILGTIFSEFCVGK